MSKLVQYADPKLKHNYNLFALNEVEHAQFELSKTSRRNFLNPKDPYLNPLKFVRNHKSVHTTNKTLGIISPLDHSLLMNKSKLKI